MLKDCYDFSSKLYDAIWEDEERAEANREKYEQIHIHLIGGIFSEMRRLVQLIGTCIKYVLKKIFRISFFNIN